ncbi:MAG: hypothetical protein JNM88_02940 [Chitinophagaceae bacterium]|nr:hypothetical protein [Chitinophagaceae bacterium]
MTDKPQYDTKQLTEFLANEVVCGATKSIPFNYLDLLDKIFSAYEPPYDRHGLIGTFAAHRKLDMTFSPTLNYLLEHKYVRATADNSKLFVLTERGERAQDKGDIKKFEQDEKWNTTIKRSREFLVTFLFPFITVVLLFPQTCGKSSVKIDDPIKVILDSTSLNSCPNCNYKPCNNDTISKNDTNNIKP